MKQRFYSRERGGLVFIAAVVLLLLVLLVFLTLTIFSKVGQFRLALVGRVTGEPGVLRVHVYDTTDPTFPLPGVEVRLYKRTRERYVYVERQFTTVSKPYVQFSSLSLTDSYLVKVYSQQYFEGSLEIGTLKDKVRAESLEIYSIQNAVPVSVR